MTQQQIEKAAKENASTHFGLINKEWWARKNGFEDGAQWRVNSVWHDASKELPDIGKHVVNEDWFDFIAKDEKDLQRIIKKYPFKLWAYVADLLPDGKEDR